MITFSSFLKSPHTPRRAKHHEYGNLFFAGVQESRQRRRRAPKSCRVRCGRAMDGPVSHKSLDICYSPSLDWMSDCSWDGFSCLFAGDKFDLNN
ncbi:hypothetical protein CEXT_374021 [Caerostris extrusa]|uniref:Uncharacterized protein n=1 Tax=Caerostris extrusa TaxID=172846 RepID=A0AAV4YCL9_CAEEX|nr:hypothetical protein CEXT_374021 [Caerostris extrusa]